jgi:hypothetical protein
LIPDAFFRPIRTRRASEINLFVIPDDDLPSDCLILAPEITCLPNLADSPVPNHPAGASERPGALIFADPIS